MDVESLKKSGSSRVRCLDVFLVVSVVLLFAAVGVVTVGLFFGMKQQAKTLEPEQLCDKTASSPQPYASDVVDTMQNVAFLQADKSNLTSGTMRWTAQSIGAGTSVGSLFVFHAGQHSIRATRDGNYFIYIELKLTCSYNCDAGRFTVSVGDRLTCTFELPQRRSSTTPEYRKCWQVTRMDKETQLTTELTAEKQLDNWTIDVAASKQGIYLVG